MSVIGTKSTIARLRAMPRPLTVKELAAVFFVAEDTVLKWVREGQVPAFRVGRAVRIDAHLLADMLQKDLEEWQRKMDVIFSRADRLSKLVDLQLQSDGKAENDGID